MSRETATIAANENGDTNENGGTDGEASPSDRADARNPWIDWQVQAGDDPALLAIGLEMTGITLHRWCDL
jgi:hypothetical protein